MKIQIAAVPFIAGCLLAGLLGTSISNALVMSFTACIFALTGNINWILPKKELRDVGH